MSTEPTTCPACGTTNHGGELEYIVDWRCRQCRQRLIKMWTNGQRVIMVNRNSFAGAPKRSRQGQWRA